MDIKLLNIYVVEPEQMLFLQLMCETLWSSWSGAFYHLTCSSSDEELNQSVDENHVTPIKKSRTS